MVYIDGVPVGHPTYNQFRSDIASLFPGRTNSDGAVGFLTLNTTTLADGVHTIAWGVTDNAANAEGIGSRYFTVLNGAASSSITVERSSSTQSANGQALEVRQSATTGDSTGEAVAALDSVPLSGTPTYLRTGFDQTASLDIVDTDRRGVSRVEATEMKRFQLTLGAPVTGVRIDTKGTSWRTGACGRCRSAPSSIAKPASSSGSRGSGSSVLTRWCSCGSPVSCAREFPSRCTSARASNQYRGPRRPSLFCNLHQRHAAWASTRAAANAKMADSQCSSTATAR